MIVDLTKERKYYDEYDYSNRIQSLLPTNEYYYDKSENGFISHTVSSELYSENYLLIGIYNEEPRKVTVMLLGNDNTTVHYPTSENEQLYSLKESKEILRTFDKHYRRYSIMIQAKETLTISSVLSRINEKKIIGAITKIVNIDNDDVYPFKILSLSSERRFFVGKFRPQKGNVSQIKFGKFNIENINNPFPASFYLKLPHKRQNISLTVSFTADSTAVDQNDFVVKGYIVTSSLINEYLIEQQRQIEGEEIEVRYQEENKNYIASLVSGGANRNFLLVKISKSESNTKEYSTCEINTNAVGKFSYQTIDPYKYSYFTLNSFDKITFELKSTCSLCDVFEIDIDEEILTKSNYYIGHSIEKYAEIPKFVNGTEIKRISDIKEKGFTSYIVSMNSEEHGNKILLSLFFIQKEDYTLSIDDTISFMIKYKTAKTKEELINFDFSNENFSNKDKKRS